MSFYCILLGGCRSGQTNAPPMIEFSRVPPADEGGAERVALIEGRVIGARPGQRIVLFARSGSWYVQPFVELPFTEIQPDAHWENITHLGTEYAALLVAPGYQPPSKSDVLPAQGGAVVAVAVKTGEIKIIVPPFWQTWQFHLSVGLIGLLMLMAFHRFRLDQLTRRLNARFEARLEERMRIAQELQDTLLQDFVSASLQLHVAVEQVPEESEAKPHLNRVQRLIEQIIDEGHHTVRSLRSSLADFLALEQAFSRIPQELVASEQVEFRVIVKGRPRALHPILRDEVYRIGREVLIEAFHRSGHLSGYASGHPSGHPSQMNIEVELKYTARHLRLLIRDEGGEIDPQALRSTRDADRKLAGMRERAERIGARLKVRNAAPAWTEIELSIPSRVAYLHRPSVRLLEWVTGLSPRMLLARLRKPRISRDE